MPKNITQYHSQGLFVKPYSGEITYYSIPNFTVLKKIEKVQNFEYSIQNNRIDLDSFGSSFISYQGINGAPNVNFRFEYVSDGFTNENRLNLSVGHFQNQKFDLMFSGISKSGFIDRKDFYLIVNKDNLNINKFNNINDLSIQPTKESDVIDNNSKNYSLIHFQNCYLTNYSFESTINNLPIVSQEYVADNLIFYLTGSGIKYNLLNLKSGFLEEQADTIVIPKSFNYNDSKLSGQNILLPGNMNVSFETKNNTGSNFYSESIQSLKFQIDFNRKAIKNLNYKFTTERELVFPIIAQIQTNLLISGDLSGSFFNTLDQDNDYNIIINSTSNRRDINPTKFIFSGCKFNGINYSSSIDNSKTADLNFILPIDYDFGRKGIFVSGNVLYAIDTSNNKKVLMY